MSDPKEPKAQEEQKDPKEPKDPKKPKEIKNAKNELRSPQILAHETSAMRDKRLKRKLNQNRWNKIVANLKNNICPQCEKRREKLDMHKTYIDCAIDDERAYDVQIIMCNKCLRNIRDAQNDAIIEFKDLEIKMQKKDIKILKLKLDLYSDSDGDESASEVDSDYESDIDPDLYDDKDCQNEKETSREEDKVFNFKNLKVKTKPLKSHNPACKLN